MGAIHVSNILESPEFKALDAAGQFKLLSVELARQLSRTTVHVAPYGASGLERFRSSSPEQQQRIVSYLIAYALSLEEFDMAKEAGHSSCSLPL